MTSNKRRKIDDQVLYQMLVERGQTQSDVAAHFGVSEAAVSKRVKALNIHLSRHVALERAKEVADHGLRLFLAIPWIDVSEAMATKEAVIIRGQVHLSRAAMVG